MIEIPYIVAKYASGRFLRAEVQGRRMVSAVANDMGGMQLTIELMVDDLARTHVSQSINLPRRECDALVGELISYGKEKEMDWTNCIVRKTTDTRNMLATVIGVANNEAEIHYFSPKVASENETVSVNMLEAVYTIAKVEGDSDALLAMSDEELMASIQEFREARKRIPKTSSLSKKPSKTKDLEAMLRKLQGMNK